MRKLIAAFNMTLDGVCDHNAGIADKELHQHYSNLLRNSGILLYGRITYQLMEDYWPTVVKYPTGDKAMDDFAVEIDNIEKIVFSNSLQKLDWKNSRIASRDLATEVADLKKQTGGDILAGSRSIIITLLNLGLVDEFQLCVQPVIAGAGMKLFDNIDRIGLKLINTKILQQSGSIIFYYRPE